MSVVDDNYASSVDVVVVDGGSCISPKLRRSTSREELHIRDVFVDIDLMQEFVCSENKCLDWIKLRAKQLKLVTTMTGRSRNKKDRIGFGLRKKVAKALKAQNKDLKIVTTLFKFGVQINGFFKPSADNKRNVQVYKRYKSEYVAALNIEDVINAQSNDHNNRKKKWTTEDVDQLVESRCKTNPPSFRSIALSLNQSNQRLQTVMDRPFNEHDCRNKWHSLFPSSQDANKAVEYIRELRKI